MLDVDRVRLELDSEAKRLLEQGKEKDLMARAYAETVRRARESLMRGCPVVVAATFSRADFKAPLKALCEESPSFGPIRIFRFNVGSIEEIKRRIQSRIESGDPSPIQTEEKYRWALTLPTPWWDGAGVIELDAEQSTDSLVRQILHLCSDLISS